ncbi:MAG: hypothetical protein RLY86_2990 [Pseudomonadota bacterium]|jgi:protein ImuA
MPAATARPPVSAAPSDRLRLLAELRERVRRIEGVGGADGSAVVPLGIPDLDRALPGGGLALGALHEVVGPEVDLDSGAATAFAAVLLGRLSAGRGPVFWICRRLDLYAPGLAGYGLSPDRLVLVHVEGTGRAAAADALWAMEEALRCREVGAVLAEVGELDLSASRRLQLAAEAGGVPGLLLRLGPRRLEASAAVTRWSLRAAPVEAADGWLGAGQADRGPGTGDAAAAAGGGLSPGAIPRAARSLLRTGGAGGGSGSGGRQGIEAAANAMGAEFHASAWRVELVRSRGGQPGDWHLTWLFDPLAGLGRLVGRPLVASVGLGPVGFGPGREAAAGTQPDLGPLRPGRGQLAPLDAVDLGGRPGAPLGGLPGGLKIRRAG